MTGPSVVVFDRDGNFASLQRSVLRGMGIIGSGLVQTEKALLTELVIGRDLILMNWNEDWSGLTALLKSIRNKTTSPDPFVGIILMSSLLSSERSRAALCAGVNSMVAVPFSAGQIVAHVRFVLGKAWCFVDAPDYFGPDRRLHDEPFDKPERRTAQCRILCGEDLAAERARMRSTALAAFEIKVANAS